MFPVVYREHSYPPLVQLDRISDSDSDDVGSIPVGRANKKVSFVYQTKETFLSDAFLAEREAHCVRDADFVCDARLRRVLERIASPITAQRHHLSLICKEAYFAI